MSTIVTESEMAGAWQIFDKMRNSVIEGSKLRVEFEELRKQVELLTKQVESTKAENKRLDDRLGEALQENVNLRVQAVETNATITRLRRESDDWMKQKNALEDRYNAEADARKVAERLFDEQSEMLHKVTEERDRLQKFRDTVESATKALGISTVESAPVEDRKEEIVEPLVEPTIEVYPEPVKEAAPQVFPTGLGPTGGGAGSAAEQPRDDTGRFQPYQATARMSWED